MADKEDIKVNSPMGPKVSPKKEVVNTTNLEVRIAELETENAFLKERLVALEHFAKTGRMLT
jgi:hypothetical protein